MPNNDQCPTPEPSPTMEFLRKFKYIISLVILAFTGAGVVMASDYRYVMLFELEDHERTHEEKDQRQAWQSRLAILKIERRVTKAEIRAAVKDGDTEEETDLREDLSNIKTEILDIEEKLRNS